MELYEIENAIYAIKLISLGNLYDYGHSFWQFLVHRYVPAQILGKDFKLWLKGDGAELDFQVVGYSAPPGLTFTGLTDTYLAFGLAGCLVFGVIAWVMQRLLLRASAGDVVAQTWFALLLPASLHALPTRPVGI